MRETAQEQQLLEASPPDCSGGTCMARPASSDRAV
jgi:hypothetical protein